MFPFSKLLLPVFTNFMSFIDISVIDSLFYISMKKVIRNIYVKSDTVI